MSGTTITSTLGGKGYFSVAVLPTKAGDSDSTRTALATTYGRYAHAHVTGTRCPTPTTRRSSTVTTTYAFTTEPREGTENGTVVSLYPHQWKALAGAAPRSRRRTCRRAAP